MVDTEPATRSRVRRLALPALTGAVGLLIAVPAAMHLVAVVGVAYRERGGYDARLAQLLWIGWTSLPCGLLMVAAAPTIARGPEPARDVALRVAGGAAAVFAVGTALLAPAAPSFAWGIPIFGGYAALAGGLLLARRRAGSPS